MSKFFTRFEPPKSAALDFKDSPRLVAVEFKDECDINTLIKRYKATGSFYSIEQLNKARRRPQFADFTGIPDYQETLDKMNAALEMFGDLPLNIRQRFHDSPVELLAFLQDENNRPEAETLGIIEKTIETSEKPPVVTPSTTQEETT